MKPPKEYAIELVDKFYGLVDGSLKNDTVKAFDLHYNNGEVKPKTFREIMAFSRKRKAKQCTEIAVNEIISYTKTFGDVTDLDIKYHQEVLKEIQNVI